MCGMRFSLRCDSGHAPGEEVEEGGQLLTGDADEARARVHNRNTVRRGTQRQALLILRHGKRSR